MNKYQHLFSPIKIGTVEVPNRIALLPMGVFSPRMMNNDGSYTKDGADYYIERAKGGTGLIITGLVPVPKGAGLPSIVNEGRRVVNNIERVASMYLIKTTYSFLLCFLSIGLSHEYPFYPIQLSLISSVCVGIPSFFLALEPNYNKVDKDFIAKVFRNAVPNGITVVLNIFIIIMFCTIFNKNFENYRLVVVTLTGFITLRLLYTICKPLNLWRKILLIFCTISFFELLILLPDLFLVSKFGIVSIVFILLLAFVDTYIIDFLSELFDKIIIKIKEVKNEKRKKENKLS